MNGENGDGKNGKGVKNSSSKNIKNTVTTTEEVVENRIQVEYIGAEYAQRPDDGFKKKKYEWDPIDFGPFGKDGDVKGDGDGDDNLQGKRLTDEEIRELMQNDPAAVQFLKQIVPDGGEDDGDGIKYTAEIITVPKEGDDNDYDLNLRMGGRIQKSIRIRRHKEK